MRRIATRAYPTLQGHPARSSPEAELIRAAASDDLGLAARPAATGSWRCRGAAGKITSPSRRLLRPLARARHRHAGAGRRPWYPTLGCLRDLFQTKTVVGMDVVELAPQPGAHAAEFLAASLAHKCLAFLQAADGGGGRA